MRGFLHSGVDRVAMWLEDRVPHEGQPYHPCEPGPLGCYEPVPALWDPPAGDGLWSAASPRRLFPGDRMALHVTVHRARFLGTVVLVPPWKTETPALLRRYTELLANLGHDVWLVVPPEHMGRSSPGARSGHGFATLDLRRFRALFEQLVVELRAALAMAKRRGPTGLVAVSVGALAASFALTSPEAPEFAALVAPPADLAGVLLATPIGRRYRRLAERAGSRWPGPAELRRALAPFDPRGRPSPSCRVFLAIGRYDRIALVEGALALAREWGVSPSVYARGHLTLIFRCRSLLGDLARFVAHPGSGALASA